MHLYSSFKKRIFYHSSFIEQRNYSTQVMAGCTAQIPSIIQRVALFIQARVTRSLVSSFIILSPSQDTMPVSHWISTLTTYATPLLRLHAG